MTALLFRQTAVKRPRRSSGRGREAAGLELVDEVAGDGVRTVPSSFKSTAELVQFAV